MFFPPEALQNWLQALQNGQVTAAPAEGVYGYCANPFSPQALAALLEIKNRSPEKGLILLISKPEQVTQLCPKLPASCQTAIQTYWQPHQPPTTLILPALATLPEILTGNRPTIAVRCPQSAYMQEYLTAWGQPLVSTSLNKSGQPPAIQARQIPAGIPALTIKEALAGQSSRIYNPLEDVWLR